MSEAVKYHDNTLVQRRRWGNEYLAVTFREVEAGWFPYSCSLTRYCVPGRIDTYAFDYTPGKPGIGPRIRFFTDTHESLPSDLVEFLIAPLSPKSRTLKALRQARYKTAPKHTP